MYFGWENSSRLFFETLKAPNPINVAQTPAYQQRLAQLEDDAVIRRNNVNRSNNKI
jgi:hypothetical protein